MRTLGESFAVLAVGFATLAVPLALSARSTACTFALEGAALVWLGFRQQRRLPRWSGLALQALAAGAFLLALIFDSGAADTIAIANGSCISAVLIAAAAFVSAMLYAKHGANRQIAMLLYLWGLAWWIGAGLREIDRFVPVRFEPQALLAFAALSAGLAGGAWRWLRQGGARMDGRDRARARRRARVRVCRCAARVRSWAGASRLSRRMRRSAS